MPYIESPKIEMFRLQNDDNGKEVLKLLKKSLNHERYRLRARGRKPDRDLCGQGHKFRDGHVKRSWAKEVAVYIDDHFEYDRERKAQRELWGKEEEIRKLKEACADLKKQRDFHAERAVMLTVDRDFYKQKCEEGVKPNDADSVITRLQDLLDNYREKQYAERHANNKFKEACREAWKQIGVVEEIFEEAFKEETKDL